MSSRPQATTAAKKQPKSIFHQMATVSWAAPLAVVAINYFLRNSSTHGEPAQALVFTLLALFLYLAGLICGIAALTGMRRHGKKGILLPALIGILLNGGMLTALGYLFMVSAEAGP